MECFSYVKGKGGGAFSARGECFLHEGSLFLHEVSGVLLHEGSVVFLHEGSGVFFLHEGSVFCMRGGCFFFGMRGVFFAHEVFFACYTGSLLGGRISMHTLVYSETRRSVMKIGL